MKKYTDEQFIEAIKSSFSVATTLGKLGLAGSGGNYKIFYAKVKQLNLDISHFTGQGHLKGKKHNWNKKYSLEEILVEDSNYQSHKLKNRLLKEGIKEHKCESCNLTTWLNKPVPLELEHVNGINTDNRLENLLLICPNCHAMTDTYRGKNKGKNKQQ